MTKKKGEDRLMQLELSQLRIDGGTQPRAAINNQTVMEYAEALREGVKIPASRGLPRQRQVLARRRLSSVPRSQRGRVGTRSRRMFAKARSAMPFCTPSAPTRSMDCRALLRTGTEPSPPCSNTNWSRPTRKATRGRTWKSPDGVTCMRRRFAACARSTRRRTRNGVPSIGRAEA